MIQWSGLTDAYGDAAQIPSLIDDWVSSPTEGKLSDLWGRLCHQGSVYSASFEAIPLLHRALPVLPPGDRRNAVILIGAILSSRDRRGGAVPDEAVLGLVPDLAECAEASLDDPGVDESEFPYLLQAAAAFRGEALWGRVLDHLATEEFDGICAHCNHALFLEMGSLGYFASCDDYVRNTNVKRVPIVPASPDALAPVGAWLFQQAIQRAKNTTAIGVKHIFGSTTCPNCSSAISVAEAIEGAYGTK